MFAWLGRLLRRVRPGSAQPAGGPEDRLGPRSERIARAFLERAGFSILAANYRCPLGELDLVADGEGKLVFVEVKARRMPASGPAVRPEDAVHRGKQKKIGRCARHFTRARKLETRLVRFDVIAIDWPPEGDPIIRHHKAAFRPNV